MRSETFGKSAAGASPINRIAITAYTFENEVDPEGELSVQERAKRAEWARKAYYQRLR
ncbi:hypothetical protein MCNS_18410 [Mycobacterium conspicuum]|uniref:Uncharacterized protein n=1 Tax=Mycobacterium conspicuum TaxID=44010 RepID=A0A7I7YAM9_9MYCO|nr:hypothetical protein MCNS_18410 [Mycobacterium conspicuum]